MNEERIRIIERYENLFKWANHTYNYFRDKLDLLIPYDKTIDHLIFEVDDNDEDIYLNCHQNETRYWLTLDEALDLLKTKEKLSFDDFYE